MAEWRYAAPAARRFCASFALFLPLIASAAGAFPIKVVNNCTTPILVRGRSNAGGLPDLILSGKGDRGAQNAYAVDLPFTSGNIFGCWNDKARSLDPSNVWEMEKYCGMAEMTINAGGSGPNIDISYVDILTLAMRIAIDGATGCNAGGQPVDPAQCFQQTKPFNVAAAQAGCPTTTEKDVTGCWGAAKYCDPSPYAAPGGNPNSAFCKQLDAVVRGCSKVDASCQPTATDLLHPSFAAYGCTGFFATEAGRGFCGKINRGTLGGGAPYTTAPFNTYAQHVHAVAGNIYAFPYDDVGNESGDVGAAHAVGMTITYCPG